MSAPRPDQRDDTTAQLAAVGIVVTAEGKARARAKLDAAAARRDPAARAALRERLGLPPVTAA